METEKEDAENPVASKLPVLTDNEKKKLVDESKEAFYRRRRIQILHLPVGTTKEEIANSLLKSFKVIKTIINEQNIAHVLLSDGEEAKKAMSFVQGKIYKGRMLATTFSQSGYLLFVSNILYNTTLQQFKEIMKTYGEIERILLVHSELTGQSKGYAFVEYTNEDDIAKAKAEFSKANKNMKIDYANSGLLEYYDLQSQTLSITNLASATKSEQIEEIINKHVQVPFCKIPTNAETGKPHDYALVDCKTPEDAEMLWKKLDGTDINGGTIRVHFNSPGQLASTVLGGQSSKTSIPTVTKSITIQSKLTPRMTISQSRPQRPSVSKRPQGPAAIPAEVRPRGPFLHRPPQSLLRMDIPRIPAGDAQERLKGPTDPRFRAPFRKPGFRPDIRFRFPGHGPSFRPRVQEFRFQHARPRGEYPHFGNANRFVNNEAADAERDERHHREGTLNPELRMKEQNQRIHSQLPRRQEKSFFDDKRSSNTHHGGFNSRGQNVRSEHQRNYDRHREDRHQRIMEEKFEMYKESSDGYREFDEQEDIAVNQSRDFRFVRNHGGRREFDHTLKPFKRDYERNLQQRDHDQNQREFSHDEEYHSRQDSKHHAGLTGHRELEMRNDRTLMHPRDGFSRFHEQPETHTHEPINDYNRSENFRSERERNPHDGESRRSFMERNLPSRDVGPYEPGPRQLRDAPDIRDRSMNQPMSESFQNRPRETNQYSRDYQHNQFDPSSFNEENIWNHGNTDNVRHRDLNHGRNMQDTAPVRFGSPLQGSARLPGNLQNEAPFNPKGNRIIDGGNHQIREDTMMSRPSLEKPPFSGPQSYGETINDQPPQNRTLQGSPIHGSMLQSRFAHEPSQQKPPPQGLPYRGLQAEDTLQPASSPQGLPPDGPPLQGSLPHGPSVKGPPLQGPPSQRPSSHGLLLQGPPLRGSTSQRSTLQGPHMQDIPTRGIQTQNNLHQFRPPKGPLPHEQPLQGLTPQCPIPQDQPPHGQPRQGPPPHGQQLQGPPPQGPPPQGPPPQGPPPQGPPPQGPPPQGPPPQGPPPQGPPLQGQTPQSQPLQALTPQGLQLQRLPLQGPPPQGPPPQGPPPQGPPPQGPPPQGPPPQGPPPQGLRMQGLVPQINQSQNFAQQGPPSRSLTPQDQPPQEDLRQSQAPHGLLLQNLAFQNFRPQGPPLQDLSSQSQLSQDYARQGPPPRGNLPPNYPTQEALPNSLQSRNLFPQRPPSQDLTSYPYPTQDNTKHCPPPQGLPSQGQTLQGLPSQAPPLQSPLSHGPSSQGPPSQGLPPQVPLSQAPPQTFPTQDYLGQRAPPEGVQLQTPQLQSSSTHVFQPHDRTRQGLPAQNLPSQESLIQAHSVQSNLPQDSKTQYPLAQSSSHQSRIQQATSQQAHSQQGLLTQGLQLQDFFPQGQFQKLPPPQGQQSSSAQTIPMQSTQGRLALQPQSILSQSHPQPAPAPKSGLEQSQAGERATVTERLQTNVTSEALPAKTQTQKPVVQRQLNIQHGALFPYSALQQQFQSQQQKSERQARAVVSSQELSNATVSQSPVIDQLHKSSLTQQKGQDLTQVATNLPIPQKIPASIASLMSPSLGGSVTNTILSNTSQAISSTTGLPMPNVPFATGLPAVSGLRRHDSGILSPGSSSMPTSLQMVATPGTAEETVQKKTQLDSYVAAASAAKQYAEYYQQLAKQQETNTKSASETGSKDAAKLASQAHAYAQYYQQYYQQMQQIIQLAKPPTISGQQQQKQQQENEVSLPQLHKPVSALSGPLLQSTGILSQPTAQLSYQQRSILSNSQQQFAASVTLSNVSSNALQHQQGTSMQTWLSHQNPASSISISHGMASIQDKNSFSPAQQMIHSVHSQSTLGLPVMQTGNLSAKPLMSPLLDQPITQKNSQLPKPPMPMQLQKPISQPQQKFSQETTLFHRPRILPSHESTPSALRDNQELMQQRAGIGNQPPAHIQQNVSAINWMNVKTESTNTIQPQHLSRPALFTTPRATKQLGDKRPNDAFRPFGLNKRPRF